MDYNKQTYLNTESIRDMYRRERVLTSGVPAGSPVGGIRFVCEKRTRVTLEIVYTSLSGRYRAHFDDIPSADKDAPYLRLDVIADKGTHIFETENVSGTNGGAVLRVTGVGIKEGRRYYERVGGYYTSSQIVVYTRRGERCVQEEIYEDGALTFTERSSLFSDACLHYDKVNESYTSDVAKMDAFSLQGIRLRYGSADSTISIGTLTSACIADGYGLPTGADALLACTDTNGVLHFFTCVRSGAVTEATTTMSGIRRVVSAQRGSMLFVQNAENVWRVLLFRSSGEEESLSGGLHIPYDVFELNRSAVYTPCGDVNASAPVVYYRNSADILVQRDLTDETVDMGYADAFCAGEDGGLFMSDNDMTYKG